MSFPCVRLVRIAAVGSAMITTMVAVPCAAADDAVQLVWSLNAEAAPEPVGEITP
jgi:hypothetical protein